MAHSRIIHIVDDEGAIRRSTSFILKTSGYAVATYASGVLFLNEVRHVDPGCVLLDVRMPDMDGLEVQQALAERGITMPVIVFTGHGEVSVAIRAMKAGAIDFIEKPFEKAVLLSAITRAFDHLEDQTKRASHSAEARTQIEALTGPERGVLGGLANGDPNKTIAYDLGMSSRTVEVHRANLMQKLAVRSLSDALRVAFAAGLGNRQH